MESAHSNGDGPMLVELKRVHGMIRADLAKARALAESARDGDAATEMRAGVDELKTNGILWTLRTNCLTHCQFVHQHHTNEDSMLFPLLMREDPGMGPVVDRLMADHRRVSDLLDEVEGTARGSLETDPQVRERLAAALDELAEHLHEHLEFEEEAIAPVLNRWTAWPGA